MPAWQSSPVHDVGSTLSKVHELLSRQRQAYDPRLKRSGIGHLQLCLACALASFGWRQAYGKQRYQLGLVRHKPSECTDLSEGVWAAPGIGLFSDGHKVLHGRYACSCRTIQPKGIMKMDGPMSLSIFSLSGTASSRELESSGRAAGNAYLESRPGWII